MKRIALPLILLFFAACQSTQPAAAPLPGHGAVAIEIVPNPIVATRVSGNTYDFPFEVVVRETGGHPITVNRISAVVSLRGGLTVARETWDADDIRALGYGTTILANAEVRYRFTPRKDVPDERLFGGVQAELRVDATDDTSTATNSSTVVTVTR
jgi:hypothetical protein